jgi:hypothetical protein
MKKIIPRIEREITDGDEPAATCVTPFFVSEEYPTGFFWNQ